MAASGRAEAGVSLGFERRLPLVQHPAALGTRVDVELVVDAGQVRLDSLRADEGPVCDLPIGPPGGDELGNSLFARRHVARRTPDRYARKLRLDPPHPCRDPEPLLTPQRLFEGSPLRVPCLA